MDVQSLVRPDTLPSREFPQPGPAATPSPLSRGPAARLIWARDGREALRAAVDLCRNHLRSPVVGILIGGVRPWFVSRGVDPALRADIARDIALNVRARGVSSAVEIATLVATAMPDAQVVSAGRAALVVGPTRSAADERLLARVAGSVRSAIEPEEPDAEELPPVSDALAWTAHEFRQPLGAVQAVLDRLMQSGSSRPEDPSLLRAARDEVSRLLQVVDPLLKFASGDVGESGPEIDLVSVAADVIEAETRSHPSDGRRVSFQAAGSLPVRADPAMAGVALGNLVRNALVHSGARDPVSVSLFRMDGRAVAQVWDSGPGVPRDEREQVFRRSVRGRAAGTEPGNGLGLFIAARIAEGYGGGVSLVDSPRGADFRFELPLATERSLPSAS